MDTPSPADLAAPPSEHVPMAERPPRREPAFSPFPPLLLIVVSVVGWAAFQTFQLVAERGALANVHANQTRPFEDATKLRNALDGLARETQLLADKGNPSAKLIVNELARRGVTINTAPPGAAADKAAK